MKKLKYICIGLLTLLCYNFAAFAQKEAEELNLLGNALITSLQDNDLDGFLQVHANEKDLKELTDKNSRIASKKEPESKQEDQNFTNMENTFKENFEQIIQDGISRQINWNEVQFSRIVNSGQASKERNMDIVSNPVFAFSYKEEELKLKVDKVAKLNRGWVVLGNVSLQ